MSFETVVQLTVYEALSADAALNAVVSGVFDDVMQDADYPYVTVGENDHATTDTDTELHNQVSIIIHTWSRVSGRKQTKEIQGLVYDVLHRADLTQAGYDFITITQETSQSFLDDDGHTRHGVQTFKLLVEKV